MSKKKVLWISNYGYNNSYCTVTRTLLKAFLKKYPDEIDLYLLCIGQTQHYDFADRVSLELGLPAHKIYFPVIRTIKFNNEEDNEFMKYLVQGIYHLKNVYEKVKPDIVITLNDDTPIIVQQKMAIKLGIKLVPYLTFDQDFIGEKFKIAEDEYPAVITPALHSQVEFSKKFKCPVHLLPHIVDTKTFFPVENKYELKKKWVGNGDAFVILAVNRNNIRKRWDLLIQTFQQFAENKQNVILLIKTDKYSDDEEKFSVIDAPQYVFQKNNPKFIFIEREVSDIELNEIYNCGDIGLSTTSGEGFGLTPCEMSLCKIPQILPNNTTAPWIFGENYEGLINCKQYSGSVARSFLKVKDIEKDLICILKIYPHWETSVEISSVKGPLKMTNGIHTVILSEDITLNVGYINNGIPVFENIPDLLRYLDNHVNDYDLRLSYTRIQVLLNTNINFIEKTNFDELFSKKWENKKIIQVNPTHLKAYTTSIGSTGLASVQHGVELLNKFYNNPELRKKCGEECYERVHSKFNSDLVVDTMLDLLVNKL